MSQFTFPRINFHGSVYLDMPTANNGKFAPLEIYDQKEGLPYKPPQINLDSSQYTHVKQTWPNLTIVDDGDGKYHVPIEPINDPEKQKAWAIKPLDNTGPDKAYFPLYQYVNIAGEQPGYWNYFGDMSIYTREVKVTGIQVPDGGQGVVTYTPENLQGCPPIFAQMLEAQLSFHDDFFNKASKTTAVMVDVDSIGQTCTQMFIGKAGIYAHTEAGPISFFSGKPSKSVFNWLSLSNVLNWYSSSIMPMSGSATFCSTISLKHCNADLQKLLDHYAGTQVDALFMKIMVHQVYESRNPDYSKMHVTEVGNNRTKVPKNPAQVAFTGSICPALPGEMKSHSICRILKNPPPLMTYVDKTKMLIPEAIGEQPEERVPLEIIDSFQFAPAFLHADTKHNLISLDLSNTMCGIGTEQGSFSCWAGRNTVPPFTAFENFDFGKMTLNFLPDGSGVPNSVLSFDHASFYHMANFLATGGVLDIVVNDASAYQNGSFFLSCGGTNILIEDPYLILSDQQGTYAEQNQVPADLYMSDGLPLEPIIIRAFYRGQPIAQADNKHCCIQTVDIQAETVSDAQQPLYDGMKFQYPVDKDGCKAYGFAVLQEDQKPCPTQVLAHDLSNADYWLANGYYLSARVLSAEPQLDDYLSGAKPITWEVVRDNVLATFDTVVPIMSMILPFEEPRWSNHYMLPRMLMLTDESNWSEPMYMPVSREMSAPQRQLLQMWAKQILASPSKKQS